MESHTISAKARSGPLGWLNSQSLKWGRSFPTWVVFDNHLHRKDPESLTPSARSRFSNGDDVLVSFRLVAPPGASHLCLHLPRETKMFGGTALLAAHLDSVLFRVVAPFGPITDSWCCHADYFVCKAASTTSRLSIYGPLPPCYIDDRRMAGEGHAERSHMLGLRDIGLLRRGEEEFAVADLLVLIPDDNDSVAKEAELFRYRSNAVSQQWEVKRMLIPQEGDNDTDRGLRWWTADKVVSFEGYLCWIDYYRSILSCDVLADDPQLRFAALPVETPKGDPDHPEYGMAHPFVTRSLCVTDCGSTMVFVNVARDDGEIASKRRIGSGFTMTRWSLGTPLNSTTICWEETGAMRAEEIWCQLPRFEPRIPFLSPEFPFIRLNEHNIVYALLCERRCAAGRTWVLVIDMKSRKLKSVIPYNEGEDTCWEDEDNMGMWSMNIYTHEPLLPSVFSMYLNLVGRVPLAL